MLARLSALGWAALAALGAGWLWALAGAILASAGRRELANRAHGLALLLVGVSLIIGAAPAWDSWAEAGQRGALPAAVAILLLIALSHRRSAGETARRGAASFELALAWLATIAGAAGILGALGLL